MPEAALEEAIETPSAATIRRRGAVVAVAVLAISNILVNRVWAEWAYLPWNLAMAGVMVVIARRSGYGFAGVGLAFRRWHRPVGVGLLLVAVTALVFALGLILPSTRSAFLDNRVADTGLADMLYQSLIRIPLGTVLLEEIAFRGVLPTLFGGNPAARWRWKPVLGASVLFGAWHILPSMGLASGNSAVHDMLGGSVVLTVLLAVASTTLVGVLLCVACFIGKGLKTSILVHCATNTLGFVVAWMVIN